MKTEEAEKLPENIFTRGEDFFVSTYLYRNFFRFTRLQKDQLWYVTYQNCIIACGQYRNDLEEWIDINYI